MKPDLSKATETELLVIKFHDPMSTIDDIYESDRLLKEKRKSALQHPRTNQKIKPVYPR